MTQQESELLAMREMAEWRIKKLLAKEPSILESVVFVRTGRGLRRSDFTELIEKMVSDRTITRVRSEGAGAYVLSLAPAQTTQPE